MTITPEYRNLLVAERKLLDVIESSSLARDAAICAGSLCKVIEMKVRLREYYIAHRKTRATITDATVFDAEVSSRESINPQTVPTPPTPMPQTDGGDLDNKQPHGTQRNPEVSGKSSRVECD